MSLNSIISTASSALLSTQYAIGVSNTNVSNARDTSYSRQTYSSSPVTSTTALYSGNVQRAADSYLRMSALKSSASASYASAISSYLQNYDSALGSTTLGDDLSSLVTGFQTALSELASDPSASAGRSALIDSAQMLAAKVNHLSASLQSMRTQASKEISTKVEQANESLQQIASLNQQIVSRKTGGGETSALEDARDAALATLASLMGANASVGSDGRMTVYSQSGELLVGFTASVLAYQSPGQLSANATYPDVLPGVLLNGSDITSSLTTGAIGALITLRDETLVVEQSKLDTFVVSLVGEINAASNAGTAYPPPSSLTGSSEHGGGDFLSGSGEVIVALVDRSGVLTSSERIDLASFATVGDLVSALDAIDGLSAVLNDAGSLVLTSETTGVGIAIGASTSSIGGQSFSSFFGLNDFFAGSNAASLSVSSRLLSDPAALPAAMLSDNVTTPGNRVMASGDGSSLAGLISALTRNVTIDGKPTSLSDYTSDIVASAATLISSAATKAELAETMYDNVLTRLANLTGVNVDEEMALLTQLQNQYQANAQLISTARDLFDVLISMVR